MDARNAAVFLRAFGDPTRLRILHALAVGPLSVGELASTLEVPFPRVSRHLRYLDARGLVTWASDRHWVVYRLATAQHSLHRSVLKTVLACVSELPEVQQDRRRLERKGRE